MLIFFLDRYLLTMLKIENNVKNIKNIKIMRNRTIILLHILCLLTEPGHCFFYYNHVFDKFILKIRNYKIIFHLKCIFFICIIHVRSFIILHNLNAQ